MKNFIKKAIAFIKETVEVAVRKVIRFVRGVYENIETIAIIVLAAFGLANLLGELPFLITLPLWVEAPFVAPVAAILIIKALMFLSQKRFDRRHRPNLGLVA